MTNPFHPFTPPFRFNSQTAQILDSNEVEVFVVSGWDKAKKRSASLKDQDATANAVAQLMNEHAMKEGL